MSNVVQSVNENADMKSYTQRLWLLYTLDLVGMCVISLISFLIEKINPVQRPIPLDDPTIKLPFTKHEWVPWWMIFPISVGGPSILILCFWAHRRFQPKRLFVAFFGVGLSVSIAYLITSILKVCVGRLRPDFLDRCQPEKAALPKIICKGSAAFVNEGRRSFPSGHTSLCFAGLGFASLFLAGQFRLFNQHGALLISWATSLFLAPALAAGFVGVSRIVDNRHHWQDVLVGALLGFCTAYASYRIYFGPLMGGTSDSASPNPSRFNAVYSKYHRQDRPTESPTRRQTSITFRDEQMQSALNTTSSPFKQYSPSPPPHIGNI